jgi:hypothetical protein
MRVPVTTAWRILGLRMEKIWRVAANMLNKQSRTAEKEWSYSLGLGEGLTNSYRRKEACFEMLNRISELKGFFGTTYTTVNECGVWIIECYGVPIGQIH